MKYFLWFCCLGLWSHAVSAQKLPPFTAWEHNNSPDCVNTVLTKDSIVLPVKNKCETEGKKENWRPLAGVSEGLAFAVKKGAKIQLSITYKFQPVGGDILGFYGSYDIESNDDNNGVSKYLQLPDGSKSLPPSTGFITQTILINFDDDSTKPVWTSPNNYHGTMNFHFNVSTNGGPTHIGSRAVIKAVKLETLP
ncbi:MAG: hypothetical protein U0Y10_11245 [Spirosomataceae bacterium]